MTLGIPALAQNNKKLDINPEAAIITFLLCHLTSEHIVLTSGMDFYDRPVTGTFALNRYRWFDLPKSDNTIVKVIAVTSDEASYWIVAYTIIVALIFAGITRLVVDLVLAFFPVENSGNRIIMLVAFYNANNPTTAAILMLHYCRRALFNIRSIQPTGRMVDWPTFRCAFMLLAIAGSLIGASLGAQFLVSGRQLIERHATRANAAVLFYPDFRNTERNLLDELKPIRGSAGFQALGRYETSRRNLKNRVHVNREDLPADNGRPMAQYNYSYEITGYEMGLQDAPELKYNVNGFCKTDYSIYSRTDDMESWNYWPSWPGYENEFSTKSEEEMPPYLGLNNNPDQARVGSPLNVSSIKENGFMFGLTPHTSFRFSTSENLHDPWYSTELDLDSNKPKYERKWRVKRGRPGLRCVQHDTYTLREQTVYHVDDLKNLRGLKLSKLLRDEVFPFEFGIPPISQLTLNLGLNNLASSLYYYPPSKSFTAGKASLEEDLTKLISVTFLYSREVARNLFLVYSTLDPKGLQNIAAVNGVVPDENADVILESSEVAALSVKVLVVTPIVCVVIWILVVMRLHIVQPQARTDNLGPLARLNLHTIGLQATQLYRCLDELLNGQMRWSGRLSPTPFIKEVKVVDEDRACGITGGTREDRNQGAPFIKNVGEDRICSVTGEGIEDEGQNDVTAKPFALPKLVRMESDIVGSNKSQYDLMMTTEMNPNAGRPESSVGWRNVKN
ncbi:hypothetical protein BDD12DRAFT_900219 [Trichophaea hybrida]|nr:hypothetical protein BDD12DRAFT_900219 [Trichophaea hybrida]